MNEDIIFNQNSSDIVSYFTFRSGSCVRVLSDATTFNDIQASFRVMLLKEENERVLSMKNEIFVLMYITRIEKKRFSSLNCLLQHIIIIIIIIMTSKSQSSLDIVCFCSAGMKLNIFLT